MKKKLIKTLSESVFDENDFENGFYCNFDLLILNHFLTSILIDWVFDLMTYFHFDLHDENYQIYQEQMDQLVDVVASIASYYYRICLMNMKHFVVMLMHMMLWNLLHYLHDHHLRLWMQNLVISALFCWKYIYLERFYCRYISISYISSNSSIGYMFVVPVFRKCHLPFDILIHFGFTFIFVARELFLST